jgi:hypothetical protein
VRKYWAATREGFEIKLGDIFLKESFGVCGGMTLSHLFKGLGNTYF